MGLTDPTVPASPLGRFAGLASLFYTVRSTARTQHDMARTKQTARKAARDKILAGPHASKLLEAEAAARKREASRRARSGCVPDPAVRYWQIIRIGALRADTRVFYYDPAPLTDDALRAVKARNLEQAANPFDDDESVLAMVPDAPVTISRVIVNV